MDDQATKSETSPFALQTLRWLALGVFAVRLVTLALFQPFMDETYYWMWGQHPALSYFDHPPLIGWTQGLSAAVFGWNLFALRAPVLLAMLGDLGVLYLFARRLSGERWQEHFWLTALLFLTTPVYFLLTSLALPDHLAILALLTSLYCVHGVLVAHDAGQRATRLIYLGAVALGLALLCKFTLALAAIGMLAFLILSPRYRVLLRNPHLWVAVLVALAMQTPVIVWNVQHDYAGFGYVTGGRAGLANLLRFGGTLGYLFGIVLMLSPFLLVPAWRFLVDRREAAAGIARTIAWVSTLAFLVASIFTNILVHWNLVAYVAALPFLGVYLRSRLLLVGHLVFSALFMVAIVVNYGVFPLVAAVDTTDRTSAWSFGWDETAARVEALKLEHPDAFVAGSGYELASQLGFAMHDRDIVSLANSRDAYDDIFDAKAHAGMEALIVADGYRRIGPIARHFTNAELLETVEVKRLGRTVATRQIYLGSGFVP
ncbi:MAG: glycosyltransferase family 39 protein [Devosia sp.]